jgi:sulfide dehydrogenase cytochrome subunit
MCASIILILVLLTAGELHAALGAEVAKRCDGCHGPNGHSEEPDVPAIGGFSAYAILDLLESFRIGDRPARPHEDADGIETDMKEISESLSAEEAQAVAHYYAAQSWQPRKQAFDAALAKRGAAVHEIKCDRCHSGYGSDPDDELALVLGQWRDYLAQEFRSFDERKRKMPRKMGDKYDSLSASDKRAILELYVSGGEF